MQRFYQSIRAKFRACDSGQATVELAFGATVLFLLIFASIDFGRALNDLQVMADLTRQGSNLASRGTSLPEAAAAVISGESGLDLANHGLVIVTSVTNEKSVFTITGQASDGKLAQSSKIGTGVGTNVTKTLPASAESSLQNGQTVYVTEVFYTFNALTPLGTITNDAVELPSTLYNSAYF
jgi:Flp pilus assembly protein TadG